MFAFARAAPDTWRKLAKPLGAKLTNFGYFMFSENESNKKSYLPGIGFGIAIGLGIGIVLDSVILGLGIGIAVGIAFRAITQGQYGK